MATTPLLWKSQTQVNTSDGGVNQVDGQIIGLADGGYVVVWTDNSSVHSPNGSAIVGQRYSALGVKVGGEVHLGLLTLGHPQTAPAMAALPNGGIAIAFVDTAPSPGFDQDIVVTRFNASLGFIGTDFIDLGSAQTFNPSIAAFADGSYVVSYTIGSGADTDIVARIVSPGVVVGPQFDIDNQTDRRDFSELATLSGGNFVAVYQDEFHGSATDTNIVFRIMTAAGVQVAGLTSVAGAADGGLETDPEVAALAGGGFVVVWTDPDTTIEDIRATILTAAGNTVASNILVNTSTAGMQYSPSAVALTDGGFVVTWSDPNTNLTRAQRFDVLGNKVGVEFTVESASTGFDAPAALLLDGRFATATHSASDDFDVTTSIWDPYGPRPADFNHDVRTDLLWRHDGDGLVGEWLMNGGASPATAAFNGAPLEWHVEGTGDFNGDGNSDILWRHVGGDIGTWHMNGTQVLSTQVFANAPPQWHVQGTADFNGDGKTDLLWRHDNGTVGTWHMNGATTLSTQTFANAPPDWHIRGTGDFNGDGKADIFWRHDNGTVGTWHMNGAQILSQASFGVQPADWHITGQHFEYI